MKKNDMEIAISSDEWHPIHDFLLKWLDKNGHEIVEFGSILSKKDESWVESTITAAKAVASGQCEKGISCCWSGTGASIAANKVKGIRAALCWDEETVEQANIWNHTNFLILPNRVLTEPLVEAILSAWFKDYDKEIGRTEIKKLRDFEDTF